MPEDVTDHSRPQHARRILGDLDDVVAGGTPADLAGGPVMAYGEGACFVDADGRRFVDWDLAGGALLFGHRPRPVVEAVVGQARESGTLSVLAHRLHHEVARKIAQVVPGVELVAFTPSAAEAAQAAVRLARAFTGKDLVLQFEGAYHGPLDCHAVSCDPPLDLAGPERRPATVRCNAGVPRAVEACVLAGPHNDLEAVERIVRENSGHLAAVLCDPVLGGAGVIPPADGWLSGLRRICDDSGVLLIFDEAATGFRVALGGAQELYGVQADLACWSGALGAGAPGSAALGGRREIMELVTLTGVLDQRAYQGDPLALAGMNATLDILVHDGERVYAHLERIARALVAGTERILAEHGTGAQVQRVGSLWQVYFGCDGSVTRYRQARLGDRLLYRRLHAECLERGVYFPGSPRAHWSSSTAHTQTEVDRTLEVLEAAARRVTRP